MTTVTLTAMQREVLERVACGSTYQQIAREMCLSPSTVRTHVHAAIRRLGATDGTSAVLAYMRSPERLREAALSLHDQHNSMSVESWERVVGLVLDELCPPTR